MFVIKKFIIPMKTKRRCVTEVEASLEELAVHEKVRRSLISSHDKSASFYVKVVDKFGKKLVAENNTLDELCLEQKVTF